MPILDRLEQFLNARAPIISIVFGIIIETRFVFPINASDAIALTTSPFGACTLSELEVPVYL